MTPAARRPTDHGPRPTAHGPASPVAPTVAEGRSRAGPGPKLPHSSRFAAWRPRSPMRGAAGWSSPENRSQACGRPMPGPISLLAGLRRWGLLRRPGPRSPRRPRHDRRWFAAVLVRRCGLGVRRPPASARGDRSGRSLVPAVRAVLWDVEELLAERGLRSTMSRLLPRDRARSTGRRSRRDMGLRGTRTSYRLRSRPRQAGSKWPKSVDYCQLDLTRTRERARKGSGDGTT